VGATRTIRCVRVRTRSNTAVLVEGVIWTDLDRILGVTGEWILRS
jgi:hypothetical protein